MQATPADITPPLVLDGGLSNVLEAAGCDLDQDLWCAGMLLTDPEAIVAAHLEYLHAGADIITSAGYQASIPGFMQAGRSEEEAWALLRRAVELADAARQHFLNEEASSERPILVAASMGPYGAYLADGSEYTGDYPASDDELAEFHRGRLRCLAESGADLLAFETLPCLREVAVVAELLAEARKPAWVSLSFRDASHLHDGTRITEALGLLRDLPDLFALGANCTAPEHIADIIRRVKQAAPGKRVIVYPNSGEVYQVATGSWLETSKPVDFRQLASEWLDLGADIIGGCCRIGPAHIRDLRSVVDERGVSPAR